MNWQTTILQSSTLSITIRGHHPDLLVGIRWSICISKPQRILCVSFSRTDSSLCVYHLVVWSNFNSQCLTFSIQSRLLLLLCEFAYYHYFKILRVFHTSLSWWFSTGVWMTASLFKPPGFSSVFNAVSLFSSPPVLVPIVIGALGTRTALYRAHKLQLVSLL